MGDLKRVEASEFMRNRLLGAPFPMSNPDPFSISEEILGVAEETATEEILNLIHPTLDSEERRNDVTEFVQRLIKQSIGCELFPYGSVPLKTYLPDGDIDMTALTKEESLAPAVVAVLRSEERNENSEYVVKDTQFIDAEVKLVRCLVQNIVIDISFNQLGGLCTLCFLEQIDRFVGKDHLFKRSIILIKAWCYYESRILGAHHGLISTYALEILVLSIFRLFSSSLNGPLAVLYRFLDYFTQFDWDKHCVSLDGPVCKSSIPNIIVEQVDNRREDLMLSEEFLRDCIDMFSVPTRSNETSSRAYQLKNLNIIDPLKENNNLGRSVHKGNFYRIRSAFRFGARKLGRVLQLPRERIPDEIKKFFSNTLERHKRNFGPILLNPALILSDKDSGILSVPSPVDHFSEDEIYSELLNDEFDDDMLHMEDKSDLEFTEESVPSGKARKMPEDSQTNKISGSCPGSANLSPESNILPNSLALNLKEDKGTSRCSVETEPLDPLSDLKGDSDSQIRSLLCAQSFLGYNLSARILSTCPPMSAPHLAAAKPCETVFPSVPLVPNHHPHLNPITAAAAAATMSMGVPFYPAVSSPIPSNAAFYWDGRHSMHGMGIYFPNSNGFACGERPKWRGRSNRGGHHFQPRRYGRGNGPTDMTSFSEGSFNSEPPKADPLVQGPRWKPNSPVPFQQSTQQAQCHCPPTQTSTRQVTRVNSFPSGLQNSQRKLVFGSFGPVDEAQFCEGPSTALNLQNSRLVYGKKQERAAEMPFQLKNEEEFPPLSAAIS